MISDEKTRDTAKAFDASQLSASALSDNGFHGSELGENLPDVPAQKIEQRIQDVNAEIEREKLWGKLLRRSMDLEKLKLANRAPRCCYNKTNGEKCRAPAWGRRLFCAFHARAMEQADGSRLKISVLADRQSIQLTLKQIMEELVSGRITPQVAAQMLRASYIALGTLKPKTVKARPAKVARKSRQEIEDERMAALEQKTDEEIEAEIEQLEKEIADIEAAMEAAGVPRRKSRRNPGEAGVNPAEPGVDPGKLGVNPEEKSG